MLATATLPVHAVQPAFDALLCNDEDAYLVHVANSQQVNYVSVTASTLTCRPSSKSFNSFDPTPIV